MNERRWTLDTDAAPPPAHRYAPALVTTAYEMPAHDSNPSKEWNPLYALPSRPASTLSRTPWVLSTDMDQEVDTW